VDVFENNTEVSLSPCDDILDFLSALWGHLS
jgi:hypothetical protein